MRARAVGKKFPAIYIAVFPRSSPLRTFRLGAGGETSTLQRQKFHTDDVYTINPIVMGLQMLICSILCFSWSIMVKFCFLRRI